MTNYYQINYTNFYGKRRARGINASTLEEAIELVEEDAIEGTMSLEYIDDTKINWMIRLSGLFSLWFSLDSIKFSLIITT